MKDPFAMFRLTVLAFAFCSTFKCDFEGCAVWHVASFLLAVLFSRSTLEFTKWAQKSILSSSLAWQSTIMLFRMLSTFSRTMTRFLRKICVACYQQKCFKRGKKPYHLEMICCISKSGFDLLFEKYWKRKKI